MHKPLRSKKQRTKAAIRCLPFDLVEAAGKATAAAVLDDSGSGKPGAVARSPAGGCCGRDWRERVHDRWRDGVFLPQVAIICLFDEGRTGRPSNVA